MGGDSPQALFYKRCLAQDGSFNDSWSSTLQQIQHENIGNKYFINICYFYSSMISNY